MVDPPIADRAKTIDDLMIRGIKFAADKRNFFALLEKPNYQKYGENFMVFGNITEFFELQDKFDTRYAFAVTNMWTIYEEQ